MKEAEKMIELWKRADFHVQGDEQNRSVEEVHFNLWTEFQHWNKKTSEDVFAYFWPLGSDMVIYDFQIENRQIGSPEAKNKNILRCFKCRSGWPASSAPPNHAHMRL